MVPMLALADLAVRKARYEAESLKDFPRFGEDLRPPNPVRDPLKYQSMIEDLRVGRRLPPVVRWRNRLLTGSHRFYATEYAHRQWEQGATDWENSPEPELTIYDISDSDLHKALTKLGIKHIDDIKNWNPLAKAIHQTTSDPNVRAAVKDQYGKRGPKETVIERLKARYSALVGKQFYRFDADLLRIKVRYAWKESEHPRGQPDNAGEFAPKGGGVAAHAHSAVKKIKKVREPAFRGKPVAVKTKISKQHAGAIGEAVVIEWLKSQGLKDARHLNLDRNNFPIDLVQDHAVIEVKTGLVSNSSGAQQWRLTIGEPGKKEKEWLAKASEEQKAKWNAKKQAMIHERKKKALADLSKKLGAKVKARTVTVLLNPDTRTCDIYVFDGWHDRIGWNSDVARASYKGSVQYAG